MSERIFFIDPTRCIHCRTCEASCASRDGHHGVTMIHFTTTYPGGRSHNFAQVCMHCTAPLCVRVCPADAIPVAADGTVLGVDSYRCTGCKLCVEACPFEVPLCVESLNTVMKCDMCYDRCLGGAKPLCVTACPTGALAFMSISEAEEKRRGTILRNWTTDGETIRTKAGLISHDDGDLFGDLLFDIADAVQGTGPRLDNTDGAR